jgi:signal transduction histidine kinase
MNNTLYSLSMSASEKIRLWKELSKASNELDTSCTVLGKRDKTLEKDEYTNDIKLMVHQFREAFALLFLLRVQSKLMEGLIDHDFIDRFSTISLQLEILSRTPSVERLTDVCDKIWVFSQVVKSLIFWIDHEETSLEKTMLDVYVVEVRRYLSLTFPHLDMRVRPVDQDLPVMMHKGIITNIIINMIVNARKHGNASQVELLSSKLDESNAQLTIQDNGTGMNIPYKQIVPGLGLLYLERRLEIMKATLEVEEHGGVNQGAAFKMIFPLAYGGPETVQVKIEEPPEM